MASNSGAVMEKPVGRSVCKHHWLIDPPDGPTSKAVCKICGEVKMFDNILADLLAIKDISEVFESDNSVEIEAEPEGVA